MPRELEEVPCHLMSSPHSEASATISLVICQQIRWTASAVGLRKKAETLACCCDHMWPQFPQLHCSPNMSKCKWHTSALDWEWVNYIILYIYIWYMYQHHINILYYMIFATYYIRVLEFARWCQWKPTSAKWQGLSLLNCVCERVHQQVCLLSNSSQWTRSRNTYHAAPCGECYKEV